MKHFLRPYFLSFVPYFLGSLPSAAAVTAVPAVPSESEIVGTLPEITATRSAEPTLSVPYTTRALAGADLATKQARSLPEALRELPGVHVQKTSNGQGSPFVRGFTGFRNLALIDGVRFNNSTFREGPNQYWNTIDLGSAERLELVPGQGGVLYGSDAIGGTLNVLTRQSGFREPKAGKFFNGESGYRFSSAEDSHTGRTGINLGEGGKWGLHVDGAWQQFGNVDAAGLGRQPKTGYDQWAFHARLDAALDEHWTLTAVHQQLQQDDVWRTHSTVFGIPWMGTEIGSDLRRSFDQERSLSYVRLAGSDLGTWADAASLTLSYQQADELQNRIKKDGARELSSVGVDTWGLDLQLLSETPLGNFTYGIDYYQDSVDSASRSTDAKTGAVKSAIQGPVGDDSTAQLFGAYIQDKIDKDDWHFYLGGRYTHAKTEVGRFENPLTKAADSFEDTWQDVSLSARAVYDLDEAKEYALYGGASQGFRSPNLSDLSRLDIARSGELEVAATDLDPEKFLNFELGLKAETEKFTGSAAYFHTRINDLILRQPTGETNGENTVVTKANGGEGYVHGLELAGNYKIDESWSIFANGTWMEGEVAQFPGKDKKAVTEPLSRIVPYFGTAGVHWQNAADTVWLELAATLASKVDRLNSADRADTQRIPPGGTPGWALVSLRGGWQVTEKISLTASLDNLLDEEYRTHGSGSNEAGIGGTVSVSVKF